MPFSSHLRSLSLFGSASTVLLVVLYVGAGAGCGASQPQQEAQGVVPVELPLLDAELVGIEPLPWPTMVRAQGSLVADEVSVVGTKVPGRVAGVHVDLGDQVRAGQKLVTLDQSEFQLRIMQAEGALAQAFAAVGLRPGEDVAKLNREQAPPAREAMAVWEKAKADLVRNRELFAAEAITEVELEQSVTAERVAEAQYASTLNNISTSIAAIQVRSAELAMAREQLADTVVVAPFDGMVQRRHVAPGTYVSVGQAMVTVVRTSRLRYRGVVPERHAHRLALGQEVRLYVDSLDKPRIARITRISPVVDEMSRSLVFEADVDNSDGRIRSGLFAEAEVVLDPSAEAIVVDAESVVEFAGVEKVWKVVGGKTEEQVVETGERRGGRIEILTGLARGDWILRDGEQGKPGRIAPGSAPAKRKLTAEASLTGAVDGEDEFVPGASVLSEQAGPRARLPSTE